MNLRSSRKRLLLVLVAIAILGGGLYEFFSGPIRFYINRRYVELFRKQFPDAMFFCREIPTINGLTAERKIPGNPSYFFRANLEISYIPNRTMLIVEFVQRVKGNVLATRNQLIFADPLLSEIFKEPIDSDLFEKYPGIYPKESPVPQSK